MLNCRPASPAELSKAKVISQQSDYYSILGIKLRFRSNDQEIRDHIRHIYRWFLLSDPEPADYDFSFFAENGQTPLLLMNKQAYSLQKTDFLPNQVNNLVLNALADNLKEHFLFHGAAVSREDRGIIIVGRSGSGKTSLSLKFVHEGYEFLSDEFAPVHRQSLDIYPFPRSLGIRPGTLELFPHLKTMSMRYNLNVGQDENWLLDPALFSPRKRPCKLESIYFLGTSQVKKDYLVDMELYHEEHTFPATLSALPEVSLVCQRENKGYPVYRFRVKRKPRSLKTFLHACQPFKDLIFNRMEVQEEEPDFSRGRDFVPMDKSAATLELLKHLRNRNRSSLLRREFPNLPQLMMEMSRIVENVECWQVGV